jgi:hypothetical protein
MRETLLGQASFEKNKLTLAESPLKISIRRVTKLLVLSSYRRIRISEEMSKLVKNSDHRKNNLAERVIGRSI